MMNRKCVCIGIAPVATQLLWVEQLLDFLLIHPQVHILLPSIIASGQRNIEQHVFFELLAQQFSNSQWFEVFLQQDRLFSVEHAAAHTYAGQKIQGYLQKTAEDLSLANLNSEVNRILAQQYELLLEQDLQPDYRNFLNCVATAILRKIAQIERTTTDVFVILPIAQVQPVMKQLATTSELQLYTFNSYNEWLQI